MNQTEKEKLKQIFETVRPYLTSPSDLEEVIKKLSEKSSDLEKFENEFRKLMNEEEDPSNKTDYRIFLNKLESR